jgi:hypothetical protein
MYKIARVSGARAENSFLRFCKSLAGRAARVLKAAAADERSEMQSGEFREEII